MSRVMCTKYLPELSGADGTKAVTDMEGEDDAKVSLSPSCSGSVNASLPRRSDCA